MQERVHQFVRFCDELGVKILIYCTYRTVEEQARLYRKGRNISDINRKAHQLREEYGRPDLADLLIAVGPQHGSIVTNAGPGQSMHNYRLAADGVPLLDGKPVWNTRTRDEQEAWGIYGDMALRAGLEWAGNWTRFREFPHVQEPHIHWRDLI